VENSHLLNSSLYLVHYAFVQSQSIPFQVWISISIRNDTLFYTFVNFFR
jgi:hypothetical protein